MGLDLHATIAKHLLDSTRRPNFMRNLEMERSLVEGGGAWEVTLAHIETMIFRGENVRRVVRMLCLASLTYGQGLTLVPISAQHELFCPPCNPS